MLGGTYGWLDTVVGITEVPKLRVLPKGVSEKVLKNEAAWQLLNDRATHAATELRKSQKTGCLVESYTSVTSTGASEVRTYRVMPGAAELVGLTRKFQLELMICPGTSFGDSLFSAVAQLLAGQVRQIRLTFFQCLLVCCKVTICQGKTPDGSLHNALRQRSVVSVLHRLHSTVPPAPPYIAVMKVF